MFALDVPYRIIGISLLTHAHRYVQFDVQPLQYSPGSVKYVHNEREKRSPVKSISHWCQGHPKIWPGTWPSSQKAGKAKRDL